MKFILSEKLNWHSHFSNESRLTQILFTHPTWEKKKKKRSYLFLKKGSRKGKNNSIHVTLLQGNFLCLLFSHGGCCKVENRSCCVCDDQLYECIWVILGVEFLFGCACCDLHIYKANKTIFNLREASNKFLCSCQIIETMQLEQKRDLWFIRHSIKKDYSK